jgi:hypothetical protein
MLLSTQLPLILLSILPLLKNPSIPPPLPPPNLNLLLLLSLVTVDTLPSLVAPLVMVEVLATGIAVRLLAVGPVRLM